MSRTKIWILVLTTVLASTLVSACTQSAAGLPQNTNSPAAAVDSGTALGGASRPAPDFTLTDQFGQKVSLDEFRGKVIFLTFADDNCTTVCPLTTNTLMEMIRLLGPGAQQVQLLAVNANPDDTSVADVAAFSRAHGMSDRWLFLTGSKSELEAVWKEYGIDVAVLSGKIDHTAADFLIDADGNERRLFVTSSHYSVVVPQAQVWATQVEALLPGAAGETPPPVHLSEPASLSANDTVTLPSLTSGGAPATIGPAGSYLLAFFASWAPEVSAGLLSLNAYESEVAAGSGIPGVVAIDVGSVEPSAESGPSLISGLPGRLSYPVVLDSSGSVADAYGVQGIPWLVLVRQGHILWTYDGWLSGSSLLLQVQAALAK